MDANATDRVLLQSSKPSLHTNLDCTALVAAAVSRQVSVVRLLLQVTFFYLIPVYISFFGKICEFVVGGVNAFCENTF